MSLAYYTMDDLRLGRGGFLQKIEETNAGGDGLGKGKRNLMIFGFPPGFSSTRWEKHHDAWQKRGRRYFHFQIRTTG